MHLRLAVAVVIDILNEISTFCRILSTCGQIYTVSKKRTNFETV